MRPFALDLRHSLRRLRKDFGYTATVTLLLALGIGVNAALFSVAYSVLLRPLAYAHPEQLVVTLHEGSFPVSPADYLDYRKSIHAFTDMAAAQLWSANLLSNGRPEQIRGIQMTSGLIPLLGVAPLLGRVFLPEEEHAGHAKVLLLSFELWQQRFGGDRNIVGRQVLLDGTSYTVIGVMPSTFHFAPFWATGTQMWSPLVLDQRLDDRGGRSLRVFARLQPGRSIAEAQSEMDAMARHLGELYPQTNARLGIRVLSLREKVVGSIRPTLLVLLGVVGFVLLIACATVGNLMIARAMSRRKELALRLAVGARGRDLIRITFTEILLLAGAAGMAAILLANWAIDLLAATLPPGSIPRQAELGSNQVTIYVALAVTFGSALLTGVLPSIEAVHTDLNATLREGERGSSEGSHKGLRNFLVATEVALSLILLAGAGLMMRTTLALRSVDAGFNPHHVLTMQVSIGGSGFDRNGARSNLFRDLRERLAATAGVESASAINHLPIGGDLWNLNYAIEGRPKPAPGDEASAVYRVIMPGYFRTMQIAFRQGRDFTSYDDERAPAVAIINEAMAKRQWPNESAVGKLVHYGTNDSERALTCRVVGIVRNARQNDWTSLPADEIYLPYYQRPDSTGLSYLTFVLRTANQAGKVVEGARLAIRVSRPNLSVSEVRSMDEVVSGQLWRQHLAAILIGIFASVALLLAAVGIYGVIANAVKRRRQEFGIRVALGAQSADLLWLALREGMIPVLSGTITGLLSALFLTRFLESLLYDVTPLDPVTFAGTVAGLLLVCVGANLIPAFQAAKVDPLQALHHT